MTVKKSIIFDVDGTSINSPKEKLPSKALIDIISQLREEFFICTATGRSWSFAEPILKALKLTDPCIISGGTQICNPQTGDILWQQNIEASIVEKIITILKNEFQKWNILFNDYNEELYMSGGINLINFNPSEPIYFLEQIFVPDSLAEKIKERFKHIKEISCITMPTHRIGYKDIHFTHKSATKEHAIAELFKILNTTRQNSIGIGDGHNDIHLFNGVDYKVAMGNAVLELKELADEVIGTVQEDGLSTYLRTLLK